jgi:DNA-binding transcriptional MerR regulator
MTAHLAPEQLSPFEGRRDLTLDELVEAAESLLTSVAPVQQRYKVTARPDVRTIRYYTSQGLLPKPVGYDGGRARYALAHLLRLLFIKKLQAEHHTLARIKQQLKKASDADVRRALVATEGAGTARAEQPRARKSDARDPVIEDAPVALEPLLAISLPASDDLSPGEDALARLTFSPDTLRDPARRERLANELQALADRLKQGES